MTNCFHTLNTTILEYIGSIINALLKFIDAVRDYIRSLILSLLVLPTYVARLVVLPFFQVGLALGLSQREEEESESESYSDASLDAEIGSGTGPRRFSYTELASATDNFSKKNKLGQGGFGGVYKGFLRSSGQVVAVKKFLNSSKQARKQYISEVKIISRVRHRNLVQLLGWCHENSEFLLVSEFMPNGSLDLHLFKGETGLEWSLRYSIAVGLASALLYLHEESEQCVLHRDIKSSNVMLDYEFNAKLGDFGLARLVDHQLGHQTTAVAGTFGYLAPECWMTGKATKESDVFSYGVVALELACGRRAVEPNRDEGEESLVQWVWELNGRGALLDAVDGKLNGDFEAKQMECLMLVGLWCAHPVQSQRPSMRQVLQTLGGSEGNVDVPELPKTMPIGAFFVQASTSSTADVNSVPPSISVGSIATGR